MRKVNSKRAEADVMYKVKRYVRNQGLRILNHSVINSQVQYTWVGTTSRHQDPLSVIKNP